MQITINKKIYNLKFGFGATRRIVQHYGYNKPSDYDKIVKKLKIDKMGDDPDFDQVEFLALLFISGMQNAGEKIDFTTDDMVDVINNQPDIVVQLQTQIQQGQVPLQKTAKKK